MIEQKMVKYLGRMIPISKWVDGRVEEDMTILKAIIARLKASGISAGLAFDRGHCCVYREVIEKDIAGEGQSFHEWAKGIQAHAVESVERIRYSRNTG